MKKIIKIITAILIVVLLIIIILVLVNKKEETPKTPLFEMKEYNNIKYEQIKSINIMKYTEGGVESIMVDQPKEIKATYNKIKKIKVGKEVQTACDDNTTVYVIQFKDDTTKEVEIECDWIVIGDKRYLVK